MSGLVIKGCEYDPIESKDVVYGDGFRMELEQAIALQSATALPRPSLSPRMNMAN